ncbi:MgtC/SapB family protein [Anabaena sp. UHCC 0399]|uniref:MgtC/SapB family protein n=1 Tax=Anabaena sp. UHCC 0399 TaxID=3110238 RepID=UPI002B20264A|nr:MgtC/SapB family protein [Anabaena sp. UHCC 0399]MEA5567079.1 MgtC/SapB family protein [Anabaena sp. UHCC 0399]
MLNTYHIEPNDLLNMIFRLCLALLSGAIIGLEREIRQKPAGLRTHMLVSFGAAIFTLIPLQITTSETISEVLSRVIQGIATGVGFLGAGEIVSKSSQGSNHLEIRGLTSAAAIWVSAALGITSGCGLWQLSLIGAMLTFAILKFFKKLENSH